MSLPYVQGNWTFSSLHNDSVATPKSISVTDVRPADEYTASSTAPQNTEELRGDQVMYYLDNTGAGLQPVGYISLSRQALRNVYQNTDIPQASRLPVTGGHRLVKQLRMRYQALNSVSGLEYVIPLSHTETIIVPDWAPIPADVLYDFIRHAHGADYAGQSVVTPLPLVNALRGDLDLMR